MFISSYM